MTAVAPLPSLQPGPRPTWHAGNAASNNHHLNSMSAEDVSRMFLPRKGVQRTNSTSSVSSTSSASSVITTIAAPSSSSSAASSSSQANDGSQAVPANDANASHGGRKKPARNPWPSAKAEPVSALSTARSQIGPNPGAQTSTTTGNVTPLPQAQSMMPPITPGTQQQPSSSVQNGPRGNVAAPHPDVTPVLCLLPMNGTFERKAINVPFYPDVLRIGRQTNAKTLPTPVNGYFDSKVLSRQHAEIWADRLGKVWIRDVKSSNGTFVNGQRLSAENRDSEPHELREQDILELGIDIVSEDQRTVVHHKVAARVEHAGFYGSDTRLLELNFGDMEVAGGVGQMASAQAMRVRSGSQGSNTAGGTGGGSRLASTTASAASSNMSALGQQQRHHNFWLTPVTVEQIVKRLTNEVRSAKRQSSNLHRTGDFVETMMLQGFGMEEARPVLEEHRAPGSQQQQEKSVMPVRMDAKSRFTDPPAPPPQQPLPEKPEGARSGGDHYHGEAAGRRRSEVGERVTRSSAHSSPTKTQSSHQIVSLVEALASARREIDSQATRVKNLEGMLREERMARESAEDRAKRLEKLRGDEDADDDDDDASSDGRQPSGTEKILESLEGGGEQSEGNQEGDGETNHQSNGVIKAMDERSTVTTDQHDEAMTRLQRRLESMMADMTEMKQTVETYKRRAEAAEAESVTSRQSLAEMVERIRRMETERELQPSPAEVDGESNKKKNNPIGSDDTHGSLLGSDSSMIRPEGQRNGKPVPPATKVDGYDEDDTFDQSTATGAGSTTKTALARPSLRTSSHDHFMQSAPYASILGVVAVGLGLMAYLNGWQKVDR
ncbi:MAG: hypothetical protein M1823_003155 [Watsoniomyces obsoletus]|nr:MAG: hypothetical protein M1823_003155 [Watsoniomyces obsoletus]